MTTSTAKTVLIPLADGCEELEAVTIMDLLVRAGAKVIRAGLKPGVVTAARGTQLMPDATLDDVMEENFDLIALPGGLPGVDHLMNDPRLKQLMERQNQQQKPLAAICAAPKALVHAGVAQGKSITCYPGALEGQTEEVRSGNTRLTGTAVEIDGHLVTSRGPGTALDFALVLIEKLFDRSKKEEVEAGLVR